MTGSTAGTTTISYSVNYGCGAADTFRSVTVLALPVPGTISGAHNVYTGSTISLSTSGSSSATSTIWSSSNTAIATVTDLGATATVNPVSVGATIISYTAANSCASISDTHVVNVLPPLVVPFITSVTPVTGIPEVAVVTITGDGFDATPGNNSVYFGATRATVTAATTTSMTVTLPLGALYSSVSYTNLTSMLGCSQAGFFLPTYDATCYVAGTSSFKPRMDIAMTSPYDPNSHPRHATIGDIDGDGKPDLIVASYGTIPPPPSGLGFGSLQVSRSIGAAGSISYDAPVNFQTSNGGINIKLADLDNDGKLDVIVACSGSGVVSCMHNTSTPGTVSFATKTDIRPGQGPSEVAIADYDNDGHLDIAVVTAPTANVKIFHTYGVTVSPTGSFPPSFFGSLTSFDSFALGSSPESSGSLITADVDGDGKFDLVTSNSLDNKISVLRNTTTSGTFSFATAQLIATNSQPAEVIAVTINNDNLPEIVVANYGSSNISIYQNNSTPGSVALTKVDVPARVHPFALSAGDFNGDGKLDLAVSQYQDDSIFVMNNNYTSGSITSGAFTFNTNMFYGSDAEPQGVTVGDLDNDKKADIVVANYGANSVSIFRNTATPQSSAIAATEDSVCVGASTLVVHSPHCNGASGFWSTVTGRATAAVGSADTSAVITGVTAGADTVIYSVVYLGDTAKQRFAISVKALADTGTITGGAAAVCINSTIDFNNSAVGTWSSSDITKATVDAATGVVTGVAAGTVTISFTAQSFSCGPRSATRTIIVNPLPDAGTITASASGTCVGQSVTLTATATAGTAAWINLNPSVATVTSAGSTATVTGAASGTDTVLFVVNSTTGCGADTAVQLIGVVPASATTSVITGTPSVCQNDSSQLLNAATGGTWSSSNVAIATVDAATGMVHGVGSGTVIISYTAVYPCTTVSDTMLVTVNPLPTASTLTGASALCLGASTSLSVSVGGGTWNSSATSVATVDGLGNVFGAGVGSSDISYTVSNSCGSITTVHPVTVNALPTINASAGAPAVCFGSTTTLSATGGSTYTWSPSASLSASTGTPVTATPSTATTYTVTGTDGTTGCSNTSTVSVGVNTLPIVGASAGSSSICVGGTTTLSATGASTYSWTPGTDLSATTGTPVTFSGTSASTSTYTVTGIDINGCVGTGSVTVTVNPIPAISAAAGTSPICAGQTTTLSATGGTTYSWTPSTGLSATTGSPVTFSGTSNATYTVTGTSLGCSAQAVVSVSVNALPSIVASAGAAAVCLGSSTTLSATGGSTYTWSPSASLSASTGTPVTATPSTATTYTVTGTDGTTGCSNTSTVSVGVNTLPIVGASAGSSSICVGGTTTLSATGASTYSWTPGTDLSATTGTPVTFSGTSASTSTYTVTGIDINGCVGTGSVTVTVNPTPAITAAVGTSPICAGQTTTLSATGGTTYSWTPSTGLSASTGSPVTFSGTSSNTYTVTGTSLGCSAQAVVSVSVNALPAINASAGAAAVCLGSSTTLSATGGSTYSWTPSTDLSSSTGSPVTATPTTATIYTVTGTDGTTGCSNTATVSVGVNALPAVGASAGSSSICVGGTTTLSATGASTYSWTPGTDLSATTGTPVTFSGTSASTSTYTVTGIDINGCTGTASVAVTVNPVPSVVAAAGSPAICNGQSTTLGATGATTYSWTPGTDISATTGDVVTFNGTSTSASAYTVTGTSLGCSASAVVSVTVNPLPTISAVATDPAICIGTSTTLTASGTADAYSWTPATGLTATTGAVVNFNGTVTSAYTVTGTISATGCNNTATVAVTVNNLPDAGNITGTTPICISGTTTLSNTVTGGSWSMTNANATISGTGLVTPVSSGVDTAIYTVTNACGSAYDSFEISIDPIPSAGAITGNDTMCITSAITLTSTVIGGTWISTNTAMATVDASGVVTPLTPGVDTIMYVVANACGSDTARHTLVISDTTIIGFITAPDSVCLGAPLTLTNTVAGASGGVWSSANTAIATVDAVTGQFFSVDTGLVIVHYTVTTYCGTKDTADSVYVKPLPFAGVINGIASICAGASASLTDTTAGGVWSSSNSTVLTVTAGGVVTGVTAGTAVISYAVTNSCGTDYALDTITVKALPVLVSGPGGAVCSGTPYTYNPVSVPVSSTYDWSRATVAAITPATGAGSGAINETLTSIDPDSVTVVYTFTMAAVGCVSTQNISVIVKPTPFLSSDTSLVVCSGSPLLYIATSATENTIFSWTRPAVAGISPATAGATTGVISETLLNGNGPVITPVVYNFVLTAAGCTNNQVVHADVEPAPPVAPQITTHAPSYLCLGTMYQNFGAATTPPAGISYTWSSVNAQVWATGNTDQYSLVNFTEAGTAWVYLSASYTGFTCTSRDSFAVIVHGPESDHPEIWYLNPDFVCSPSDEDSYQWGYDDALTLDSTLLAGETNQNYYNPAPDFAGKYYWCITSRHGCTQKTYYKTPTGITNITTGGVRSMNIFPNPSNGNFSVDVASDFTEKGVLIVTNLVGEKVMEIPCTTNSKLELHLDQPAGIYMITVNTAHGKTAGKATIIGN